MVQKQNLLFSFNTNHELKINHPLQFQCFISYQINSIRNNPTFKSSNSKLPYINNIMKFLLVAFGLLVATNCAVRNRRQPEAEVEPIEAEPVEAEPT